MLLALRHSCQRSDLAMSLAAALIYWVIIALWLAVLATVGIAFVRNPRTFGAIRLLLSVLTIDTFRNIAENLYFGLYFGGQYGLFPASIVGVLGDPTYLILPKVMNVVAACAVLGLLVLRWLPLASKERSEADADIQIKSEALTQEAEERRRLFETSPESILDCLFCDGCRWPRKNGPRLMPTFRSRAKPLPKKRKSDVAYSKPRPS